MSITLSKNKIAILILAAGESKRMGSPKQLLKWGNSTLLNHSIDQAVASKADEVYLVLGANYEKIISSITEPSVVVFAHTDWRKGMGNTLAFGVNQLKDFEFDGILVMLADQPQVDTSFLNVLISEVELGDKPIVATSYKKEGGVPAIFDKSYFNELTSLLGDIGARLVINKNLVHTTLMTPSTPIIDIDTKKMYEETKSLLSPT